MNSAIVTGASGFIGVYLVKELLSNGVKVTAVVRDKSRETALERHENLNVVCCNMNEIKSLPEKAPDMAYDVFYHFAWAGTGGDSRSDEHLQTNNAVRTVDAVKAAKELGCKRFVGAGTIMEKEVQELTYTQGYISSTGAAYSTSKLMAHCLSKAAAAKMGIDHVWAIIANAYGVGDVSERFIGTMLKKIINLEPLNFTSGTQNYDFIYVSDVARVLYLIGEKGRPFFNYTIGSGDAKPLREFILEIQQTLAPERELLFGDVPFAGTSLPLSEFSIEGLTRDTGFKPEISFADGITKTMSWLREYR